MALGLGGRGLSPDAVSSYLRVLEQVVPRSGFVSLKWDSVTPEVWFIWHFVI